MVGGKVIETIDCGDKIWINCQDKNSKILAINVERDMASRSVSEGDSIWWQGIHAFWTPKGKPFSDYKLNRVGCSGITRPLIIANYG